MFKGAASHDLLLYVRKHSEALVELILSYY